MYVNYKKYNIEIVLLFISIAFVIISFIASINSIKDEFILFARSGAILVLFAVIVEYKLNSKSFKAFNLKLNFAIINKSNAKFTDNKYHKRVATFAHISIVLGTLI